MAALTDRQGGERRRALRRGAVLAGLVALALGLAALTTVAWAAKDDLDLVSRASGAAGAKGNDTSFSPAISVDGRFVAFASNASNLNPDDGDIKQDVFVRDLQVNATRLVSRATGTTGVKGNDTSFNATLSADGRFVAFDSAASNLDPADTDGNLDVFVRDLQAKHSGATRQRSTRVPQRAMSSAASPQQPPGHSEAHSKA